MTWLWSGEADKRGEEEHALSARDCKMPDALKEENTRKPSRLWSDGERNRWDVSGYDSRATNVRVVPTARGVQSMLKNPPQPSPTRFISKPFCVARSITRASIDSGFKQQSGGGTASMGAEK